MRTIRTRTAIAVASLAVGALALTGCADKFTEPFKDAPRSHHDNGDPMDVIRFSDGFSNVGFKCVGVDGVYVAYHGDSKYAALAVVANDPRCAK